LLNTTSKKVCIVKYNVKEGKALLNIKSKEVTHC